MTEIFRFLIDFIVDVFNLMLSFKFEFFGVQVSALSLTLAGIAVCAFVSFFKIKPSDIFDDSLQFNRKENKKDKKKEKKTKKE